MGLKIVTQEPFTKKTIELLLFEISQSRELVMSKGEMIALRVGSVDELVNFSEEAHSELILFFSSVCESPFLDVVLEFFVES